MADDFHILDEVYMVTLAKGIPSRDGVLYAAPGTNRADAWRNAMLAHKMSVDEMKKRGWRVEKVTIVRGM